MRREPSPEELGDQIDLLRIRLSVRAGRCLACGVPIPRGRRGMLFEQEDWMLKHLREVAL